MDITKRQITKIAREAGRFTTRILRGDGIGSSEYEYIHAVRKNPGITQAGVRELLALDKGAAARRAANLEKKGYLIRKPNPDDKRSQQLYATEKADALKNSKATLEAIYYHWLLENLPDDDRDTFVRILNALYEKSKSESKNGFPVLMQLNSAGMDKQMVSSIVKG